MPKKKEENVEVSNITKPDVFGLQEFIDKIIDAFNLRESALNSKEAELSKIQGEVILARESNNSKQVELEKRTLEVEKREAEIAVFDGKLKTQQELTEERLKVARDLELITVERKKNEEILGETKLNLEEILKREQALTLREANYKQQLKEEVVSNFIKGAL